MLEFNSLNALRHEPSASNHAIRLEPDLADAEISGSAVTANALLLLRRAADTGGLKLTATGNLSRAVVEEMFAIIQAPDYDKDELLRYQKVINEPDFLPLHFVRILAQAGHCPASTLLRPCPTPALAVAYCDVEAATLAQDGSPPITRPTFPGSPLRPRSHHPARALVSSV